MRTRQPECNLTTDGAVAGKATPGHDLKDGDIVAGGRTLKFVSKEELKQVASTVKGAPTPGCQEAVKKYLQRKLDAGETLYGAREDGTLVAVTRDGEQVIDRLPAVG